MADMLLSTQSPDPESPKSVDSLEETMPRPWATDFPGFRPPIALQYFHSTLPEDKQILEGIQSASQTCSTRLLKSDQIQSKVQKLYEQSNFCIQNRGSEDLWTFFVVWPIFQLAREIAGLEPEILALPLSTANVCPTSLSPQWDGTTIVRKVDFGLAIKLDSDVEERIKNSDQEVGGIGPSTSTPVLQKLPLFCHIEVKQQYQVVDPIVQIGVWASAVYARWEQLAQGSRDLPVTFGWTIDGPSWQLYIIRRLPDGSRQITADVRQYTTQSLHDINLIIANVVHLMEHANTKFRHDFLVNVIGITGGRTRRRGRKGQA